MQLIYVSMAIMQVATPVAFWQALRYYLSVTGMLVELSVTIIQVTVSVAVMQL